MTQIDRAVILAAGLGSRLKWITHDRPKALVKIGGEPAIAHVIRRLVASGADDIAVNAHHHAEQLAAWLGDGAAFGCRIHISYEEQLLDSGGGVRQALTLLPGSGPVAVCNCDVVADIELAALASMLPPEGCAIALVNNPPHHPGGDFCLNGSHVSASGDKRYTFAGVSVWHSALFERHAPGEPFSLATLIRETIAAGECRGMLHRGYWFDVGRPGDLLKANRKLSR